MKNVTNLTNDELDIIIKKIAKELAEQGRNWTGNRDYWASIKDGLLNIWLPEKYSNPSLIECIFTTGLGIVGFSYYLTIKIDNLSKTYVLSKEQYYSVVDIYYKHELKAERDAIIARENDYNQQISKLLET